MKKANKFLAAFLSLEIIFQLFSAVGFVNAAAGDYAGMVLDFETDTHPGYTNYYKSPTERTGNATSYGGFSVGYVNESGIGHNGSNGAMKMSYSSNSDTPVTTYAAFNTAHTGTSATELKNYRPYYGQMFKATVWYRVKSITADAQLAFYTGSNYSGIGSGVNLEWGGAPAGTPFARLTAADTEKGWQSASVVFMGGGTSTATDSGYGSAGYIELIMSDDKNRVGTEVYVDDITIEHIGAAVEVKYDANGGNMTGSSAQYGLAGDALTGTATREDAQFLGWYTDKEFTQQVTAVPEGSCTVYAKWKVLSYAGIKLNFETGDQDTETGTHPGYESYYGKPGTAAGGNASRVNGFDVGYVNETGIGHNNSNGAMRIAYSGNAENIVVNGNAGFNTAHTGANSSSLANYRPYYGQMFKVTVWYKVDSLTSDATLGFYIKSSNTGITNGINLSQYDIPYTQNECGDEVTFHSFAELTQSDVSAGWQQATVEFMGGGSSDLSNSGWGSAGYISLVMSDNTNREGTVVYIDDVDIEHLGEAVKVNYELDGGFISNSNGNAEYGLAGSELKAVAVKDGYDFAGFFADSNFTRKITTFPSENNTTVYAKWVKSLENGDLNKDGNVDGLDLVCLRKYLLGITVSENPEIYDINNDTQADIKDLVRLKKIISGFYFGPTKLTNSYKKLTERGQLTVGYLGGSITVGIGSSNRDTKSWRALTTSWLKNQYPSADIKEVNVSSGSTGSVYGAGRVKKQLISGNPDIVFVEYAVNDYYQGFTQDESERYMESIVRTIRSNNPYTDIVFVYTTDISLKGKSTIYKDAFDKVAEKYHVLTIDVGLKLLEEIGENSSDWAYNGKYFSDSVHPTDAGHEKYASYVQEFLKDNLTNGDSLLSYGLPSAMRNDLLINADFYIPEEIATQNTGKGSVEGTAFVFPEQAGETIKLTFTGTTIGMAWQLKSDSEEISICIDSEEYIALPNSNHDGTQRILFDGLENTGHTLTIKRNSGDTRFNIYGIFSSRE